MDVFNQHYYINYQKQTLLTNPQILTVSYVVLKREVFIIKKVDSQKVKHSRKDPYLISVSHFLSILVVSRYSQDVHFGHKFILIKQVIPHHLAQTYVSSSQSLMSFFSFLFFPFVHSIRLTTVLRVHVYTFPFTTHGVVSRYGLRSIGVTLSLRFTKIGKLHH